MPPDRTQVLIIDDDPADREIFKQYLLAGNAGSFVFCERPSGTLGLKACEAFVPDCILLDFSLPDMDGLAVLRQLADGPASLKYPVVMLTAIGNEQIAVEAMKLGLMDYLAKNPANMDLLGRTTENAIQKFRMAREIAEQRAELEARNNELEIAQHNLLAEKEKYRNLTEAIPQLVWSASPGQLVRYANRRLLEYSGHDANSSWSFASLIHPDDRGGFADAWSAASSSGGILEMEVRLKRASDDTFRWHLTRAVPIFGSNGRLDNWFGTCTDIENQKRTEETVRQQQKLESIGLLAGGIAHDFNNLLVGIMGGASFAIQTISKNHAAYPMLEVVVKASERAAHLTQQLLAYAGKSHFFVEPVNISRLLRETCDLLYASVPKSVTLDLQIDEAVPEFEANSGQLQQVIMNLVINGAEAVGERPGTVTVKTFAREIFDIENYYNALGYAIAPGLYVGLEVSDDGCGMDEATRTKIFEPFFTTKFTGRGLGLAAVQGIVRSLHGLIDVSSTPGKGSMFRILLPAKEVRSALATSAASSNGRAQRALILIIDDEEVVRSTAKAALEGAGHTVIECSSGDAGLELFRRHRNELDLILLDMSMPGKSGVQVLREIRAVDTAIPVAIASGYSEQEVVRRFESESISGFVQKPFTTSRLVAAVENMLSEPQSSSAVQG